MFRLLLPLLLWLLLASAAWAQPPLPLSAKKRLDRGIELYAAGRYDESASEFEAGLRDADHPDLWYALGQAERKRGDCDAAIRAYRRFLAARPPKEEAEKADANLKRCEEELASRHPAPPPVAEVGPAPSAAPPAPRPADRAPDAIAKGGGSDWGTLQVIGVGVAAIGAAVVGAGVYFAIRAQGDWDTLNEAAARGDKWSGDLQRRYDSADAAEGRATVLFVAGGAAAAIGGVLFFLGLRGRDAARAGAGGATARSPKNAWDLLGEARPAAALDQGARGGRVSARWTF